MWNSVTIGCLLSAVRHNYYKQQPLLWNSVTIGCLLSFERQNYYKQQSLICNNVSRLVMCCPLEDMLFNAIFNNISDLSWRSILLVEEIGLPGENHLPIVSHRQTL
jgi:hypothetical protein